MNNVISRAFIRFIVLLLRLFIVLSTVEVGKFTLSVDKLNSILTVLQHKRTVLVNLKFHPTYPVLFVVNVVRFRGITNWILFSVF